MVIEVRKRANREEGSGGGGEGEQTMRAEKGEEGRRGVGGGRRLERKWVTVEEDRERKKTGEKVDDSGIKKRIWW